MKEKAIELCHEFELLARGTDLPNERAEAALIAMGRTVLREAESRLRERLAAVEDTNDWRGGIIRGLEDAADLLAEMGKESRLEKGERG